ncbi:MAG: tetratricopeptide repeat protein [Alphaproteobacteria bacterium]|nr:tetratricopeptide repeat protein [Alphaproteobacteria bacterium]
MTSKVFISYRRDDSSGFAGRVHDRLASELGKDRLFMDVDAIPLGYDFVQILQDEVAKCDTLLVVIGPNWLAARDDSGNQRLINPNDFVHIEIQAALKRGIPVIPLLFDGATMPPPSDLPEALKPLSFRHGLEIRHTSFHADMEKLVAYLAGSPKAAASSLQQNAAKDVPAEREKASIQSGPVEAARVAKEKGERHETELKFEAAIASYSKAIKVDPNYVDALVRRGSCKFEIYDVEGHREDMDKALRLDPDNCEAKLGLIADDALKGRTLEIDAAIESDHCEEGAKEYYHLLKAMQFLRKLKLDQAISELNQAAKIKSKKVYSVRFQAATLATRGMCYARQGDLLKAEKDLNQALAIEPRYSIVHVMRANLLAVSGKPEAALVSLDKAVSLNSKDAAAYRTRAELRATLGRLRHALEDINASIECYPDADALCLRGKLYEEQGAIEKARSDYNEAIDLNPNSAIAYVSRATLRYGHGDIRNAESDVNFAIELDPNCFQAFYLRGIIHYSREELSRTLREFDRAIALAPEFCEAYCWRATTKRDLGDANGALQDADKAVSLEPNNPFPYGVRGTVKAFLLGDREGALADLKAALKLDPGNAEVLEVVEQLQPSFMERVRWGL